MLLFYYNQINISIKILSYPHKHRDIASVNSKHIFNIQ